MKKFIVIIMLAIMALSSFNTASYAATYSLSLTNAVTNVLSTVGWYIQKVELTTGASPNTTATVNFYDNNTQSIVYTNGSYVTRTTVATNISSVFTNTVGRIQTNIYAGQYTVTNTVAANTNTLPLVFTGTLPQNSQSTAAGLNLLTTKGLVATCNTTNVTVVITYETAYTNASN